MKIKIAIIIQMLLLSFATNAAVTLPSPGTFSWTYDYWINKKYNQANNNVYSYTNGTYTAVDYVNLVIKTIDSPETEKIDATEKLTNLCYLINKNEGIDVGDCLTGKLDANVETFLKYIVSMDYHKEQITMCINEVQSLSTTVTGNANRSNLLTSNTSNATRKTKMDICKSLGYGSELVPTWYLSTNRMSQDTSVGRVDTSSSYSLSTMSFTTSNLATTSSVNNNLTTLDCQYLMERNFNDFFKYCDLKSLVTKINKGAYACASNSDESKNNKGSSSDRHTDANEIWGIKIEKQKKRDTWGSWFVFKYRESGEGREMRKSSPKCDLTSVNNGVCETVTCSSASGCYDNITCKNFDNGSSSRVEVKYPNLENNYYVFDVQSNDYIVTNRNINFNSNVINFIKSEGLGDCTTENISYYSSPVNNANYWFGVTTTYKDTYIKNNLSEYYVDPKITNVYSGKGSTTMIPKINSTKTSKSVTYCYN